jgi:hypothetical protein
MARSVESLEEQAKEFRDLAKRTPLESYRRVWTFKAEQLEAEVRALRQEARAKQ